MESCKYVEAKVKAETEVEAEVAIELQVHHLNLNLNLNLTLNLNLNLNIYEILNIIVLAKRHLLVILPNILHCGSTFSYIYPERNKMALILILDLQFIFP